jgi:hypothetical protein
MRYILVERCSNILDTYEQEAYCFPDSMTDEDIACDELLVEDFEDFVNSVPVSFLKEQDIDIDDYIESCIWHFYEMDEDEYFEYIGD